MKPWKVDCPNGGKESYGGLLWELVLLMKHTRNITFTLIPGDGKWGNCYNKTSCSGMIGMVNREEVDFALGITKGNPWA